MLSNEKRDKAELTPKKLIPLSLGALSAGFLNGLIGAGAGIILYFLLGILFGSRGSKENLILSSASVTFFCFVSLFFYRNGSAVGISEVLRMGIPSALGGLLGAYFLRKISANAAGKIFSAVVIIGGILMLFK